MILKCNRKEFGSWRIFDNVHNLKYGLRSAKKYGSEMIKEYSFPDTTTFIWHECDAYRRKVGTLLVLEFTSNQLPYIILTFFPVFLMNDEGKTIERLRY